MLSLGRAWRATSLGVVFGLSLVAFACGKSAASGAGASSGTGGPGGATSAANGTAATGTSATGSGSTSTSTGVGGSPTAPTCPPPISAIDTSTPTTVVGTGTAASCTEAALDTAIAAGGTITFKCGAAPTTLVVTSEKKITKDTVIDGGGLVTLSGGHTTRIVHVASAWNVKTPLLTVQHLGFTAGYTTDVLNTKATTEGGAAIFREGGALNVIDCQFIDNHGAQTGQDVSGGAITSQGIGDTVVVGSQFEKNSASDGGAIGNLGNNFTVANSTFDQNSATGNMGNPGNGGNGGAIVFDGAMTTMSICGSTFTHNTAGAQGGAVFRVAYTDEDTNIDRSTFANNAADATVGLAGALYLEFTTINLTASTLSNNTAHYGGGIWIGHAAIAKIANVTIASNKADQGGGIWIAGQVTGTLTNTTIANNTVNAGGYAPGIFSGPTGLSLVNTLVVGGGCKDKPLVGAGANLQFPDTGAPCVTGIKIADPQLGTLQDNGGPTFTMVPAAGSPAIGAGTSCPPTDQRGKARPSACTLGAVEP